MKRPVSRRKSYVRHRIMKVEGILRKVGESRTFSGDEFLGGRRFIPGDYHWYSVMEHDALLASRLVIFLSCFAFDLVARFVFLRWSVRNPSLNAEFKLEFQP